MGYDVFVIKLLVTNIMKKITRFFLLAILAFGIMNIFISPVLADGYTPYGPHIPEDTGLADAVLLNIAAVSAYVSGLGFIGVSKFLNSKIA
jgi:hypothetical protein